MKILTVVGARPQFVKAAVVSRAIRERRASGAENPIEEVIVHTGQHFDKEMSEVFFDQLSIPHPDYNLGVGGLSHGAMTGRMLEGMEKIILDEKPDFTLVYGDTNSTLAGALAAAKLLVPVAHVEAGLRSYSKKMPEEINRVLADHISELLFCPTAQAVENLEKEGITRGVHNVGDVMYDASIFYRELAGKSSPIIGNLGLTGRKYALATVHRAENTDDVKRLGGILRGLARVAAAMPVILPLHPRAGKIISEKGLSAMLGGVTVIAPVSYLDMVRLEESASVIMTDSGGVQKEAFFYGVPCVTLRDETEWTETVESGWNRIAGADEDKIVESANAALADKGKRAAPAFYGDGNAAQKILRIMLDIRSAG